MKVNLVYFKPSGKYYTTSEYDSIQDLPYKVFNEVARMARSNSLPGLVPGARDYTVLVESMEHEMSCPAIIHDNEVTRCQIPQIPNHPNAKPVVLFFPCDQQREEFIAMVRQIHPEFVAKKLP